MAGIISTIDRATYENLRDTDDGGWALGSDLGEFAAGRYAAMGKTPQQKAALAAYGREKAARIRANWGMGTSNPAKDFGDDNISYRLDAKTGDPGFERSSVGGATTIPRWDDGRPTGDLLVELKSGDQGVRSAAAETYHAHVYRHGVGGTSGGYTMGKAYRLNPNEVAEAAGGMNPFAYSYEGNRMESAEDVRRFWRTRESEWRASGLSAEKYAEGLDMPDSSRDAVRMYLEGDGDYRKAFDDVDMWRQQVSAAREDHSTYAASKAGKLRQMSSFLATDDVPQTLFGIPIVSDESQYTEADLEFFRNHPEAGGYYDMGDEPVQDGTKEGAPVQDDMPVRKAKPSAVTDEELFVRGRKLINKPQDGDKVQLLRRGGFTGAAGKNSAVTDEALLRGPYGKTGSFYRITLPSGKKVEYYVNQNGQISVPTRNLATDDTSEILDLSRRLVRLHGDPEKKGFTRNGVSVNEFADNLWEHATVVKGEHTLGPIARAVGGSHAEVADVNSGDLKMSVSKVRNVGNDWTSVRWREEENRRAANKDQDYDAFLDTFYKPVSVDETTGELYVGDDPPWKKR